MAENGAEDGEGRRVVLAGGGGWDFGEGGKTTVTATDLDNKTGLSLSVPGWTVPDCPAVPVHGLAGTGRAQVGGGLHRLHRPSAQDQGTVWPGRPHLCPLQVSCSPSPGPWPG